MSVFMAVLLSVLSLPSIAQTTITLGDGTITNSTTSYPSAYGQYYTGDKNQYLILASELIAAGATPGTIGSIAFDIVTASPATSSSANLNGFNIKIDTTSATSLSSWLTVANTVYTVSSYTSTTGWNTHSFTTGFAWNGTSNIIIETCFDNYVSSSDYSDNAVCRQTATSHVSTYNYHSDGGGVCASTSSSSSYSQRPDMRFSLTPSTALDAQIMAIDTPYAPASPGTQSVYASIRNLGSTTLTSATINWSVNGVTQTPYSWTGSLATGASASVAIGTFNFLFGNNTIVAWTSAPNAGTDGFPVNDTASSTLFYSAPLNGTYTIGGTTADFATFGAAVSAILASGVGGPVVFNVNSGTYNEQVIISSAILGASSTNTVTFQSAAADPDSVILQYSASSSNNYTININGGEYITFKNMTIEALNSSYGTVVDLGNGANYNTFEGNNIVGIGTSSSNRGFYIYTGLNHYNVILNNKITGGYYGIYNYGSSTTSWSKGNRFEGNDISGFYIYGMYLYYTDSVQVIGNNIHDNTNTYGYGIYCYYINNEYKIVGNRVSITATSSSTCYGIRDSYGNYTSYNSSQSGNGLISNNMISIIGGTAAHYGIYSYYCNGTEYYNNTVNITGGSTSARCLYQYNTTSTTLNTIGTTYKNNILVNTGGGYATYFNTPAKVAASDYNDFYSTGTNLAYWSSNKTTLADLQTASSMDANSISAAAAFVAADDLHNTAFATYQTATPLTLVTDDIDGDPRSATTPCMGADEYILYSTDAGITAMTEPLAACPGVNTIKVLIKNYGIQSFTGVNVNWSVNGVPQTPYAFTGTLAAGLDQEVTLGTYTFVAGVAHNLVFSTSNPNSSTDQNPANDSLTISGFKTSLSGTYTLGTGTGYDYNSLTDVANDLTAYGVCGPTIISIDSGTYVGNMDLTSIVGVSATNTITFKSATNDKTSVKVEYSASSSTDNYVININNTPYVKFQHITFEATGSSYGYVFNISNGSDYTEITNCSIITTNASSSNFAGIYNPSTSNNHCSFTSNEFVGGYYGIYWYGSSSSSRGVDLTFDDNSVTDYYYYGINISYYDSISINGNFVMNGNSSGSVYGIRAYYTDFYDIQNNNVQIAGTSSHYGIYVYYDDGDATTSNILANNVVNLYGTGTSTWYGIYFYYNTYTNMYHNTIQMANGGSTSSRAMYQSGGSDLKIVNNIFAANNGAYSAYFNTTSAITLSNNNVYYTNGTNLAYWGGNKTSLTALQTANSMDLASVEANPVFASVATGNLTPLNAAIDNIGAALGFATDINGVTRSTTTPDAGAIEFTGLSADMAIISAEIKNGTCLSTNDSVFVKVSNAIGAAVNFTTNPLTIVWNVTGPVNSNASIIINSGTLGMTSDSIFGAAGVNLSVPGVYTLNCYIQSNAVNTYGGNDTLYSAHMLTVNDPFYVNPKYATAGPGDTVELSVSSAYFPGGAFFISEICHYKTSTGAPSGGWPSYLSSDDYIEITGVPNSDLGGITLEQWSGTSMANTYTFPVGTVLSPTGTAIIVIGSASGSPSPNDYYYFGNTSTSWGSSTAAGRILKDASGAIIDAVGYNGYTFPAASNVTSADWSNTLAGGTSSSGIHLTSPDNNTGSCWSLSASVAQDPNTLNSGITAPSPSTLTGFTWSYNNTVTSTNVVDTVVGPFTTTGVHSYIANYTTTCGLQSDTVFITAYIPTPLVVSNDTSICLGESVTLWAQMSGTAPWTFVVTDGTTIDTVTNIQASPFTVSVTPTDTTTYSVLEYWDALNIPVASTESIVVNVKSAPAVSMSTVADLCANAAAVSLSGSPTGGTFSGAGVVGSTFDPLMAGAGMQSVTYSVVGSNSCIGDTTIMINVLDAPVINAGMDQAICFGDSTTLAVNISEPFFSEYEEGSSNHKIIEVYNGTGAPLNMDNYAILTNANGSAWSGMYTFPTGTVIADGDVYLVANSSADTTLLNVSDEQLAYNAKGYLMGYNGDDVRALVKLEANGDTTIIDQIGLYDMVDPGSGWDVAGVNNATQNHTLVRKPNAGPNYGNFAASQGTDSASSDWFVYPQNTWTFAGYHTATPPTTTVLWSNAAVTQTTVVMPVVNTTYNVTVTDPTSLCASTDSVAVMVNALPVVNLGADFNLCENDMSTLDAGAGYVNYLWSNMDTTQTSDIYGTTLGVGTSTVYADVLDSNGCANVDSVDVTVLAAPVVNLGADFTMKWIAGMDTLDAGAGFSSYLWNNGWSNQTLAIGNATNTVGANTYWVVVTDTNNCSGSDTIVVTVTDDTGINGKIELISVSIYPNPATDNFFISMKGFTGAVQMDIIDLTGKVIYTETLDVQNDFLKSMDVNTLAKGIYYIKLTTNKHSQMHKIVVQ